MNLRPCPICGVKAKRWRTLRRKALEKKTKELIDRLRMLTINSSVVDADLLLDALELYPAQNGEDVDACCVNELADLLEDLLCE